MYDEALTAYDKAIEINPQDSNPWVGKAGVFLTIGKKDEGIRALNKVLEIDPNDAVARTLKLELQMFPNVLK
jgi:predicted TPR repeat methyltransferase